MEKLELVIFLKPGKSKEFNQSLLDISRKLQEHSSSFIIDELEDALSFSIIAEWDNGANMHQVLDSEDFKILSGAINSLCKKTIIRLNNRQVSNHISNLKSIIQA